MMIQNKKEFVHKHVNLEILMIDYLNINKNQDLWITQILED